jgi:hypothetical protein
LIGFVVKVGRAISQAFFIYMMVIKSCITKFIFQIKIKLDIILMWPFFGKGQSLRVIVKNF